MQVGGLSGVKQAARRARLRYGPPIMTIVAPVGGGSGGEPDGTIGYLCWGGRPSTRAPGAARRRADGAGKASCRAHALDFNAAGEREPRRDSDEPFADERQDRALPDSLRRPGGCVSPALGEHRERQGRIRAGLRQRVEARRVPQAPGALRRLSQPSLRASHGRSHRETSSRAPHDGRLSDAGRRYLSVPGCRLRQGDMAPRRGGLSRRLPREGRPGGARVLALGQRRACVDLLR